MNRVSQRLSLVRAARRVEAMTKSANREGNSRGGQTPRDHSVEFRGGGGAVGFSENEKKKKEMRQTTRKKRLRTQKPERKKGETTGPFGF